MEITLHPSIVAELEGREDPAAFVNSIVHAYLAGAFLRKSDVAGMVVLNKTYRRIAFESVETFDAVTHEFKGLTVLGQKESDSLFVPSEKLCNLLQEHQVVLVMKSKRARGIRSVEEDATFTKVGRDEMA